MTKKAKTPGATDGIKGTIPCSAIPEFVRAIAVGLLDDVDEADFCCLGVLRDLANKRAERRIEMLIERLRAASK